MNFADQRLRCSYKRSGLENPTATVRNPDTTVNITTMR